MVNIKRAGDATEESDFTLLSHMSEALSLGTVCLSCCLRDPVCPAGENRESILIVIEGCCKHVGKTVVVIEIDAISESEDGELAISDPLDAKKRKPKFIHDPKFVKEGKQDGST